MFLVIGHLDGAAALCLGNGAVHAVCDLVRIHNDKALGVAGRAANGLNQAGLAAEESLFVRVKDGNQAHLGQVQTLTQEVDAHHHVDGAKAQVFDDLHSLKSIHLVVHIFDFDALLGEVIRQVLGHLLGQGGHKHPLPALDPGIDLTQQVGHLPLHRAHRDDRVQQTGGPDDLLGHLSAVLALILARGGRDKDHLVELGLHFLKL